MTDLPRDMESDLAALADGSLASERREDVLASVRSSPELQLALAEQRRAVELLGTVDVRAPA
jgi:tellurite resistance protein